MASFIENCILGERGIRNGAKILAVAWALIWIVFGLISLVGEVQGPGGVMSHALLPGLIFLITALIACWHPAIGGILFILEGLAITAYFAVHLGDIYAVGAYFVFFYGTLPALVVGILFVYAWRISSVPGKEDSNLSADGPITKTAI